MFFYVTRLSLEFYNLKQDERSNSPRRVLRYLAGFQALLND
jgi:hypothetical protein